MQILHETPRRGDVSQLVYEIIISVLLKPAIKE